MSSILKPLYTKPLPSDAELLSQPRTTKNAKKLKKATERANEKAEKAGLPAPTEPPLRFARVKIDGRTTEVQLTRDGRGYLAESEKWYVQYKDHNGRWKRVPGYTDLESTKQKAADLVKKAERRHSDMSDPFDEHTKQPLTKHLKDFRAWMKNKGVTSQSVQLVCARAEKAVIGAGYVWIADMTSHPDRLEVWLADRRDEDANGKRRFGLQSWNYYLASTKHFCKWMIRNNRMAKDPFTKVDTKKARKDVRIERRALTPAELANLIATTAHQKTRRWLSGRDRAMLYFVASETGFRAAECGSLTPAAFDLAGDEPTVTVEAGYSKNRERTVQHLRRSAVATIKPWLQGRAATEKLWPGQWPTAAASMIRHDLRASGIAPRDNQGRTVDFHALRHTYITMLAMSGANPKVVQKLARHSSITLTMDRYTHLTKHDLTAAVEGLPELPEPQPALAVLRATGTDQANAHQLAHRGDRECLSMSLVDCAGSVRDREETSDKHGQPRTTVDSQRQHNENSASMCRSLSFLSG